MDDFRNGVIPPGVDQEEVEPLCQWIQRRTARLEPQIEIDWTIQLWASFLGHRNGSPRRASRVQKMNDLKGRSHRFPFQSKGLSQLLFVSFFGFDLRDFTQRQHPIS
jgi:hypothetical protein